MRYCQFCGEVLTNENAAICMKCGCQVTSFKNDRENIIINNNNNNNINNPLGMGIIIRKRPWYLSWFWILIFAFMTGGLSCFILIPCRISWSSKYKIQ